MDAFKEAFDSGKLFDLDFKFSDDEMRQFAVDQERALGVHRKPQTSFEEEVDSEKLFNLDFEFINGAWRASQTATPL